MLGVYIGMILHLFLNQKQEPLAAYVVTYYENLLSLVMVNEFLFAKYSFVFW